MARTIRESVRTELVISRSRFITQLSPAAGPQEARQLVADMRTEFPDARHHCSAWIVQVDGEQDREHSSDDGEPSGTAGRPMLDVLRGHGLTNVAAVVVRFFGGILLGTGGLVRAYSDSVSQAIDRATLWTVTEVPRWEISAPVASAGRLEAVLRAEGWNVEAEWGADVTLAVTTDDKNRLAAISSSELGRDVDPRPAGTVQHFSR
ncbi:IMPACT family protein [Flaviflexus huanghaiensis]|uniref:IMPACT family protein n=1 Tax=Flaviflexus huanghaiensis TaxID=1111473 RepID=UPI0015FDE28D|nr:YigZ family protein [Flaviflexus huanghaiensis]